MAKISPLAMAKDRSSTIGSSPRAVRNDTFKFSTTSNGSARMSRALFLSAHFAHCFFYSAHVAHSLFSAHFARGDR
jgi:hypothetical protein